MVHVQKSYYECWVSCKFTSDTAINEFKEFMYELLIGLNSHYGLVSMSESEVLIVEKFINNYLQKYPRFKLCDINRSLELYKKKPELNKLTPDYFETIFEKYRKSEERKLILKQFESELEEELKKTALNKPEIAGAELLKICFNEYKKTGTINLNSGKVYSLNYKLFEEKIGIDKLYELKSETLKELTRVYNHKLILCTNAIKRFEIEKEFELIKDGRGELINEVRRAHIKEYFDKFYN